MILELSSGIQLEDPSEQQIREALASLDVQREGDGFAIFAISPMTYLQVGGDATTGFDMEFQVDSMENHYRAQREDFSLDEVVAAFGGFRDGTIDWSDYGQWSLMVL
jgi:hypothetical protein